MKREGRNGQEFIMWHYARLHEIVGTPAVLMRVAGLMTGKMTTIVKNALSAGDKRLQKHHKFKKDYRFFVLYLLSKMNQLSISSLISLSCIIASPSIRCTILLRRFNPRIPWSKYPVIS
jgi:hypothetical protein